jgi:phosphotransferase system  glucose/maltose/N-acetylglucosamine-specific IIC component
LVGQRVKANGLHWLPLLGTPFLAARYHRVNRVGWYVLLLEIVLAAMLAGLFLWLLRDFQFRTPGR